MLEVINLLDQINNEEELLEQLLKEVLESKNKEALATASKIQAGRDIRFDLRKILDK